MVAAGDALLAPNITKRLIAEFSRVSSGPPAPGRERVGALTERGTEVLSLIAQGLSNGEIAVRPVVAEQTVKTHVSRTPVRLGLRDRTQAAVYAYESGLVRPAGYRPRFTGRRTPRRPEPSCAGRRRWPGPCGS